MKNKKRSWVFQHETLTHFGESSMAFSATIQVIQVWCGVATLCFEYFIIYT